MKNDAHRKIARHHLEVWLDEDMEREGHGTLVDHVENAINEAVEIVHRNNAAGLATVTYERDRLARELAELRARVEALV